MIALWKVAYSLCVFDCLNKNWMSIENNKQTLIITCSIVKDYFKVQNYNSYQVYSHLNFRFWVMHSYFMSILLVLFGLNATYVHACPQILVKIDPWAKRRINFSIEFFLQSDHILYDFRVKFCNESKYYVKIQTFSHLKINKINIFLKKLLLPLYLI